MGIQVSENLMTQFDKQVQDLNQDVDNFESDLKQWERDMLADLT